MSVVLRCPTCGTTQSDAGDCEACSDGEVRYFCTNHDGGVWLDGPVCVSCGEKFGVPPPGELFEEITEERARGRAGYEVEEAPWVTSTPEPRRPGFPIAGCLVRIVGVVFLLIAAAIIFLLLLFGGFIVT